MRIKILKEKEVGISELSQKQVKILFEDFCEDICENVDYDRWINFIKFGRKYFKKYYEKYKI